MGKTLYLECNSGISGDMTVGALLDLGASEQNLLQVLSTVPDDSFHIEIKSVNKSGINARDFNVILKHDNHDHDMEYLHGSHEIHGDGLHELAYAHRTMADVREILEQIAMSERAYQTALKIFEILAKSEAKAHNVPMEEVHFHEVGAIDSIIDIVSIAVCLDDLDITEVFVPYLAEGQGAVRCQHGMLPVPVPAVTNIVKEYSIPLQMIGIDGELVTPTGAATVAAIATSFEKPDSFIIDKVGIGAGKRNYARPSILRAMIIREGSSDTIWKLESNIDDSTGEALGFCMERLLDAGARDVHYTPVYMKKNRPAYQLNVICKKADIEKLERIIFEETTTIGIRRVEMQRTILEREDVVVRIQYGEAHVKKCILPTGESRYYPEYSSVAELAKRSGEAYSCIYNLIYSACQELDD